MPQFYCRLIRLLAICFLVRAKSPEEKDNDKMVKFIHLKSNSSDPRLWKAQHRGVAHDVVFNPSGFKILTEAGQQLFVKAISIHLIYLCSHIFFAILIFVDTINCTSFYLIFIITLSIHSICN